MSRNLFNARRIKILFLGASPSDRVRLNVFKEWSAIKKKLKEGKYRDLFDIERSEFGVSMTRARS